MAAVEDVVNEALRAIGWKRPIGWIYEGSKAARVAVEIYGQSRDELLRQEEWEFARRANIALTLLKGPPPPGGYNPAQPWTTAYPPPGFLYEYAYPADCLDLRAIQPAPGPMMQLLPRYHPFRTDNDNSLTPPARVILTNVAGAVANYRGKVTDPAAWAADFRRSLVDLLAKKFTIALGQSPELLKLTMAEAATEAPQAAQHRG